MTVDHLGAFVLPELSELRIIGRLAAPVFCFLVGWNGSYRFRWDLAVAALLCSVSDVFYWHVLPLNILWTILFGRMVLQYLKDRSPHPAIDIAAYIIWLPVSICLLEYGTLAWLWMRWGQIAREVPGSRRSLCYGICAMGMSLVMSCYNFDWHGASFFYAAAVALITLVLLERFRMEKDAVLNWPWLKVWSRYALEYYTAHRAIVYVIGAARGILKIGIHWV